MFLDKGLQRAPVGTKDVTNTLLALVYMERGYRSNTEFGGEVLQCVDISLVKLDALFRVLFGDRLKFGRDLLAWSTPVGVKVDKEEFIALAEGIELGLGCDFLDSHDGGGS